MSEETHFIDTELKFKDLESWDDYETYCENGQMVFDAICDEAALYKIASEAVKKKLDSLNSCGKFYKKQCDELIKDKRELEDKVTSLEEEIKSLKEKIDSVKLEASKQIYEDYLRSQNPLGVIEGDTFYALKKVFEHIDCPYCGGSSVIKTQTGKEFECGKCNKGKIGGFKGYAVEEIQCVKVIKTESGAFYYIDKYGSNYTTGINAYTDSSKAFKTKEDAEKYLKSLDKG